MSSQHNAAMLGPDAAAAATADAPTPSTPSLPLVPDRAASNAREDRLPTDTPLSRWIVAHRVHIFVFAAVFYALAFNGQWRVGRDSALYRGLGHALASGKGYEFTDFASRQIYPGLPVLLAGLEKAFGIRDWPAIIVIHIFSLGCLIVTYRLIGLRFPQWVAVTVTACVALNSWYLELTNEIRDDIPFLFGMLVALYGWERLRIALTEGKSKIPTAGAILLVGIGIAAVMRPTFWILAIAWVIVCGWGLVAGPHRRFYAICLALLLAVWITVMALDPRVRGFNPLAGGYERDARASIANLGTKLQQNVPELLGDGLTYGFFGQKWAPGLTQFVSVVVILSSLLLWRRNPLWTLLILGTVAVTLLMTTVPRYYVMILPLLALSWLLLLVEISRRIPPKHAERVIVIGLVVFAGMNLARSIKVIAEQRTGERTVDGKKWREVAEMSREVAKFVPEGQKVIGPWAPIMSYLSGREVVMSRDILPRSKSEPRWPIHLAALDIGYAVFPASVYAEEERKIRELMDKGVIVPTARVARVGEEWVLHQVTIDIPPTGQDWRKRPVTTGPRVTVKTTASGAPRPSPEVLEKRRKKAVAARRAAAERRAKAEARARKLEKQEKLARAERRAAAERKEAKERKKRAAARRARAAAAARATSQPATQPATTQPPAQPSAKCLPYRDFDVGGSSGQSAAVRSASICSREKCRDPWLIPWQRWPADCHASLLDSGPSQNGQVRHWSGRTA